MSINSIKQLVDAELNGQTRITTWRKSYTPVTYGTYWFDLSVTTGNPVASYWFTGCPSTATTIAQSTDGGIFHGANVSPKTKHLRMTTNISGSSIAMPMEMLLCDYLMYYPSIDELVSTTQTMSNPVSLPRYTTGEGVQVMAITLSPRVGGQSFYFTYTNSKGVSGRTSRTVVLNDRPAIGTVATSTPQSVNSGNPFIGLQDGDSGVRSIESVTMLGVDIGLFSLVLVKPLAQTQIRETDSPVEKDYFLETSDLPEIKDDAYLNYIACPGSSISGCLLLGDLKVIFN